MVDDTGDLRREHFETLTGQTFTFESADGFSQTVQLTAVTPGKGGGTLGRREGFSCLFESDAPGHWPQGNYRVVHEGLGAHVLFLVPLGPDPQSQRMRYQLIFS